jgi:hypothetical protein
MERSMMRAAWENFDRGDVRLLDNATLEAMMAEALAGEEYLAGRGDSLLVFKVRSDIGRLRDILRARADEANRVEQAEVARERKQLARDMGRDLAGLCGLPPGKYPALEREAKRQRQVRRDAVAAKRRQQ